jgi:hypothetical protein
MAPTSQTPVISLSDQVAESVQLSDVQAKAFEQAQSELEEFRKEMETKKYFSDMTEKDIKILQSFLLNDAPWKFTESLGIREVNKEIKESLEKKKGKLFMGATAYEAMYFYLSRVEGTGEKVTAKSIGDLETYLRLLKNINAARSSVAEDNKKLQHLEYVAASRSEGLDPAEEVPAN